MRSDASTVEAYLAELPEERREAIETVRKVILENLPEGYEEVMNWGMITYQVSLETSGAMDISGVDPRVKRIVDIKTPDSGELEKNRWENIDLLTPLDEVKFVICSRNDYQWAKDQVMKFDLTDKCSILFSPVHGDIEPHRLADWILEDQLNVRFQIQLHKFLWGDKPGV